MSCQCVILIIFCKCRLIQKSEIRIKRYNCNEFTFRC